MTIYGLMLIFVCRVEKGRNQGGTLVNSVNKSHFKYWNA